MKKSNLFVSVCFIFLFSLIATGCSSSDSITASTSNGDGEEGYKPEPSKIILASGPIGGGWYSSAAAISEILMREIPGLNITVIEGGGETNIKDVASGSAHIGYTFSDTFNDAVNGKSSFEGAAIENIQGLGTLYQSYFQAFVLDDNTKYQTFADLKDGAKILPGRATFSGQIFTKNLLDKHFGTTYEDIQDNGGGISYTGYSEMSDLLKDGHADAAMAITAAPSSFIMEVNSMNPIRFLEVEPELAQKISKDNAGFVPAQIPANVYDGITKPINTIGSHTVMFVSDSLPEELVKRMTQAILDHKDELAQSDSVLEFISEDTFKDGFSGMPLHPGVEAFLNN